MSKGTSTRNDWLSGQKRRKQFIELLYSKKYLDYLDDGTRGRTLRNRHFARVRRICEDVGVSYRTYTGWREKYKDFAAMVDAYVYPGRPIEANTRFDEGFAVFRKRFFGMDSPWFHLKIIDALENSKPGSVTLITIPPEHGKTTLLEDWCNMRLALDPTFRVTLGSEKQGHSRKFIKRVKGRMEVEGAAKEYVWRFGPFVAPKGSSQSRSQPWAADYFDVFKKGVYDERDYSMVGLGMGSSIRGTRTDLLVVDDPQSMDTLNQTDELFAKFRHDWLSRPGSKGRTVILMTRVGEDDFAAKLMESEILDHHIMIPVVSEEHGWLWPERYSEAEYARMRKNVGEEGWELSYMQIARPKHTQVFAKDVIEKSRDPLRTVLNVAERLNGAGILVGLDPGYGVNCVTAASAGEKFEILTSRKKKLLSGTEQIVAELEDVFHAVHLDSHPVTDLVFERNAFQKGLAVDPGILRLQGIYGFRIHPHETTGNKYDPDLGIPQMVHSLLREEITWPWADDYSRYELGELEADMLRWRPGKKGTELVQDTLMSTWFIWLLWRQRARRHRTMDASAWKSRPAPPLMVGGVR